MRKRKKQAHENYESRSNTDSFDRSRNVKDERYNRNYEYVDGKKSKIVKHPKKSSLYLIKFVKLTSQVFYIVGLTFMILGLITYFVLLKSKLVVLTENYVGDATMIMLVSGSILGFLAAILFFIMFILLFVNRKGWLRKSKAYIPGLLASFVIGAISLYVLYVSAHAQEYFINSTGMDLIYYQDIATILNDYFFPYLFNLGEKVNMYINKFWESIDTYLWVTVAALVISTILGSIYIKSIGKTLDESEHYFLKRAPRV